MWRVAKRDRRWKARGKVREKEREKERDREGDKKRGGEPGDKRLETGRYFPPLCLKEKNITQGSFPFKPVWIRGFPSIFLPQSVWGQGSLCVQHGTLFPILCTMFDEDP